MQVLEEPSELNEEPKTAAHDLQAVSVPSTKNVPESQQTGFPVGAQCRNAVLHKHSEDSVPQEEMFGQPEIVFSGHTGKKYPVFALHTAAPLSEFELSGHGMQMVEPGVPE